MTRSRKPFGPVETFAPTRRGFGLGAGAALMLGGCSVALPGSGEPPRIYVLTPKSTFGDDLPEVDWQLLIEPPQAAAGISSARIALRRSLIELEYFARAAWTDSAPLMIQTLMIESFENSEKIVSVGRQAIGLRSDFILKSDLREFQAEYMDDNGNPLPAGSPPNIRIRMNAKLVRMPHRTIAGSRTIEYLIQAPGPGMVDIIAGFDDALGKTLKRIVGWTLEEGQRIYSATNT
ncbi:MAG: ABC-type transport auxiliary lipoprotein family protein [Alphaproteobacteria bacterium]|jgi:cholesterol transport system auxiliary component|nr:membrane integrity-associated transporter subunit PqiC [Alphaproteobacteria bacterium]MEC9268483.1 ABC-type transport auxiliary lipoprotein family protein [Pseudomonadota bacterium]